MAELEYPKENIAICEFMERKFYAYKDNHSFNKPFDTYEACLEYCNQLAEKGFVPELGWKMGTGDYHKSWDWLMQVVDKIEKVWEQSFARVMDFDINTTGWNGSKTNVRICIVLLQAGNPNYYIEEKRSTKLEAVYAAVVSFIEWYNYNKPKDEK